GAAGANAAAVGVWVLLTMASQSRIGSSERRRPALRSNLRPTAAGLQKCCAMPYSLQPAAPCTCSMQTSRTLPALRPAAVLAKTRPDGTIASRNGSATVAPRPRRAWRRDMGFPVRNTAVLLLFARSVGRPLLG